MVLTDCCQKAEGSKKPKLEMQSTLEDERLGSFHVSTPNIIEELDLCKQGHAAVQDKPEMAAPLTPPAEHNQPLFKPAAGTHRISMGYMADCEQCKKGVRGHYVHWIPNQIN